jgi:hypothetical protein
MGSDSHTTTELIEVTQQLVNGQTTTTTAQTSICEHLVVVPEHLSAHGTPHRQAWATAVNLTATDHYSRPGEPR